jgi:hypothetical protein
VRVAPEDYAPLKAFFAWMIDRFMPIVPGLSPEDRPLAVLERFEARSMAIARKGLAMAVGDIVEDTWDLSAEQVGATDAALRAEGLLTLGEVRARFGRAVGRLLARGELRDENEYYLLRNAADLLPEAQRAKAWDMLGAFENAIGQGESDDPSAAT